MECKSCSIASICTLYEFVREKSQYADINISSCKMKPGTKEVIDLAERKHEANPNSWVGERPIRDFTSVSNEKKKTEAVEKKSKTHTSLQVVPVEGKSERISCPTCGGETTDDDLQVCGECHKTVCSNCGTEDLESHTIKCETCFNK